MSESREMKYFAREDSATAKALMDGPGNLEYRIDAICETTERIRRTLFGDEVEGNEGVEKTHRVIDRLLDKSAVCVAVPERIEEAVRLL